MTILRSFVFDLTFYLWTILISVVSLPALVSQRATVWISELWAIVVLLLEPDNTQMRIICGGERRRYSKTQVSGRDVGCLFATRSSIPRITSMRVAHLAAAFPVFENRIQIFNRDQIPQNRVTV